MDTKSLRHRKRQKKIKTSADNGNQEVLVLPPDLLKKLGISIGSVNNEKQGSPIETNFIPSAEIINNDIPIQQTSSDTSILETANLMKKSVFLSPTFVSTVANNIIPGEIEISTKNEEEILPREENPVEYPSKHDNRTNISTLDSEVNDTLKLYQKNNQIDTRGNLKVNGVFTSVSNCNEEFLHNICFNGNEAHEDLNKMENSHIRHSNTLDNATSSKNMTLRNSNKVSDKNGKQNNKISIISEENVPLSMLKEFKDSSKIRSLTPVSIKTIVGTKVNNDDIVIAGHSKSPNMSLDVAESIEISDKNVSRSSVNLELNIKSQCNILNNNNVVENIRTSYNRITESQEIVVNRVENSDIGLNNSKNANIDFIKDKPINRNNIENNRKYEAVSETKSNGDQFEKKMYSETNIAQIYKDNTHSKVFEINSIKNKIGCHLQTNNTETSLNMGTVSGENYTYNLKYEADNTEKIKDIESETNNQFVYQVDHIDTSNDMDLEINCNNGQIISHVDNIETPQDIHPEINCEDSQIIIQTENIETSTNTETETNCDYNQLVFQMDDIVKLDTGFVGNNNDDQRVFQTDNTETSKDTASDTNCTENQLVYQLDIIETSKEMDSENKYDIIQIVSQIHNAKTTKDMGFKPNCENNQIALQIDNITSTKDMNCEINSDSSQLVFQTDSTKISKNMKSKTSCNDNQLTYQTNIKPTMDNQLVLQTDNIESSKHMDSEIRDCNTQLISQTDTTKTFKDMESETHCDDNQLIFQTNEPSKDMETATNCENNQLFVQIDIETPKDVESEINCKDIVSQTDIIEKLPDMETNSDKNIFDLQTDHLETSKNVQSETNCDDNQLISRADNTATSNKMVCEVNCTENQTEFKSDTIEKNVTYEINKMQDQLDSQIANTEKSKFMASYSQKHNVEKNNIVKKGSLGKLDGCKASTKSKLNAKPGGKKAELKHVSLVSEQSTDQPILDRNTSMHKDGLFDNLNAIKEVSNTNIYDINPNKVKEIADYLKKNSHIYTDRNKIKKELVNSNNKSNKTKLCIQGVEKPGGIDREHTGECKVIKTYSRHNHQKLRELSTESLRKRENIDLVTTDQKFNSLNISCIRQEFCLCSDFGSLSFYESDSIYEHIHFWQHNSACSEVDVIFSIYNDELTPNNNESRSDQEEEITTEDKVETYNLCWNVFQNDFIENIDKDNKHISLVVSEYNNIAACENKCNISQLDDNAAMITNNLDSDVILETINHGVLGTDEPNSCHNAISVENNNVRVFNKNSLAESSTAKTTVVENEDTLSNVDSKITTTNVPPGSLGNIIEKESKANHAQEEIFPNIKEKSHQEDSELVTVLIEIPLTEPDLDLPSTPKIYTKKRHLSGDLGPGYPKTYEGPQVKKNIKCGACNGLFSEVDWDDHVTNDHDLIAWKAGGTFDFDNPDLMDKLSQRLKNMGFLKCSICNKEVKRIKKFLGHVKECLQQLPSNKQQARKSRTAIVKQVTCGVCQQVMEVGTWFEHIGREHNYLAWSNDEPALDLTNESTVWNHLQNIIRLNDKLTCYKCGLTRKRVKLYLSHIKTCDGSGTTLDNSSMSIDLHSTSNNLDSTVAEPLEVKIVKCGVCNKEVGSSEWINHIAKEHKYLAWRDGETPLDLEDEEAVWNHLQQFIRDNGGLVCHKCGLNRKRVKLYLSHVDTCDGTIVSLDDSLNASLSYVSKSSETIVECGVCKQKMRNSEWLEHIGKEHNYLAWQEGDTPLVLDDEEMVWQHLQNIIRHSDGLTCNKCGLNRKRVKLYLSHIKTCDGNPESRGDISLSNTSLDASAPSRQWFEVPVESDDKKMLKCGVCSQEVSVAEWTQHIGKEHSYLAWEDGTKPLDLEDDSAVRLHLLNISKINSGLICNKCEKNIKYPKVFLQHVQECAGVKPVEPEQEPKPLAFCTKNIKSDTVKCGACKESIAKDEWYDHMHRVHKYMAWIDGLPPLDVNDKDMVKEHLYEISKSLGGLTCLKCGLKRKYVKAYLVHIETCNADSIIGHLTRDLMKREEVECAVCNEKVEPKKWREHAMSKHYNIAWVVGDIPIEIHNPYAVEPYLKEYLRKYGKYTCKVCGIGRISAVGFYAHIIICGKTEEETEMYKNVCDICHNKYLRIYKSQHMTAHREAEYALERKLQAAKKIELKDEEPVIIQGGRRKAAEKAKTVIEKYKNGIDDGLFHCSKCRFSCEVESDLKDHVCVEVMWGDASDSDESVKLESCSEESDDDTDVDSNVSEEEHEALEHLNSTQKKRYPETTTVANKVTRIPYSITNVSTYMKKSADEYIEKYLTSEVLFKHWRSYEIEELSDSDISNYMPPIEESCKLRINEDSWLTCNRFESKKEKDVSIMFVGASIQCISWASPNIDKSAANSETNYLSVAAHLSTDVPRYAWDELHASRGLIQIWDLGNLLSTLPKFVLGIVHDYGTVWAMDWCPSGVRDPESEFVPEHGSVHRLGLLAVACSNGSAYVYVVPYPSSIPDKEKQFYKMKPVVELRLTSDSNRKHYQATAIKWSMQKGHSFVVVGYADGTTAYYDLNADSPLLRSTENNVTILNPYHDERVQNSCIEDMDMYPSGSVSGSRAGGVVCAGGAGGAGAALLQSHIAAGRVLFPPHWPAALLAGDDCLVNQSINELEWWGVGRRLGGMRAATGCLWCGRVAAAALPLIRLLRTHPCFPEVHKQVIGAIQMTPLGAKRKLQTDELAMVVEPITYDDAVSKYGVEFRQVFAKDKPTQQKFSTLPREAFPERFPLSDITAMKFCPTFRHHHKLALALHAGIIIITNV